MERKNVVFFYGAKNRNGEFSNHYLIEFEVLGHKYNCVEQYMMTQKALMFRDLGKVNEILNSKDPVEMKRLGREVKKFDKVRWDKAKVRVVKLAVSAKFSQNDELRKKLIETGEKLIVEANPNDRVWGIGFCKSDKRVMEKIDEWGENLLGKILMEVREELKSEELKKAA